MSSTTLNLFSYLQCQTPYFCFPHSNSLKLTEIRLSFLPQPTDTALPNVTNHLFVAVQSHFLVLTLLVLSITSGQVDLPRSWNSFLDFCTQRSVRMLLAAGKRNLNPNWFKQEESLSHLTVSSNRGLAPEQWIPWLNITRNLGSFCFTVHNILRLVPLMITKWLPTVSSAAYASWFPTRGMEEPLLPIMK